MKEFMIIWSSFILWKQNTFIYSNILESNAFMKCYVTFFKRMVHPQKTLKDTLTDLDFEKEMTLNAQFSLTPILCIPVNL